METKMRKISPWYFRPYIRQVKLSLQNLWVYKWDFIGDFIRYPITISMHLIIFLFLFNSSTIIQGYTRAEGITYILIVSMISRSLSQRGIAMIMQLKIIRGELTQDLAIPVHISLFTFSKRLGYPIYLTVISIITFIIALLLFPVTILSTTLIRALLTIIYALVAMVIQMQIYYIIGLFAFWLREVGFITRITTYSQDILGGRYFPLSWLPAGLLQLSVFLPFIQMYYIPVTIYLAKEQVHLVWLFAQLTAWVIGLQVIIHQLEAHGRMRFQGEGN